MRKIVSMILFACLLPIACFSQELKPLSFRVSVSVVADDSISGMVESYISKELRSLGDVIVTNEKPNYTLVINAMVQKSMQRSDMGVVIATAILESFDKDYLINILNDSLKEENAYVSDMANQLTSNLSSFRTLFLDTGPAEGLQKVCSKIVADFDTTVLKYDREGYQKLIDFMQQ